VTALSSRIFIAARSEQKAQEYWQLLSDLTYGEEADFPYVLTVIDPGQGVVEVCQAHHPALLLLDSDRSDASEDPLSVVRRLAQGTTQEQIPVVMVVGEESMDQAIQCMKAGARDCLIGSKLSASALQRSVSTVLTQRELQLQIARQQELQSLLSFITLQIRQSLDVAEILDTLVTLVRRYLKVDRVLIYQLLPPFNNQSKVKVVASATAPQIEVPDDRLVQDILEHHEHRFHGIHLFQPQESLLNLLDLRTPGRNLDLGDSSDGLHTALGKLGIQFQISLPIYIQSTRYGSRSCVDLQGAPSMLPLSLESQESHCIWGGLMVQHFHGPHTCQSWEIQLLEQLGAQVSIAIYQAELHQNLQALNADLEAKVEQRTHDLQVSQARKQAILRALPDLLLRVDAQGRCLDVVDQQGEHPPETEIDFSAWDHLNPHQPMPLGEEWDFSAWDWLQWDGSHWEENQALSWIKNHKPLIQKVLATGEVQVTEVEVMTYEGVTCWKEMRIAPIDDEEALVIVRDVTAQRQAQQLLQESHGELENRVMERTQQLRQATAEFEAIFYALPDGVVFTNRDRRIRLVNPSFSRLFGYRRTEVINQPIAMLFKDQKTYQIYQQSEHYRSDNFADIYRHKQGFGLVTSTVSMPLWSSQGENLGYVTLVRDTLDNYLAEETIHRSEERFQQLVTHINDVFWIADLCPPTMVYVSPGYEKIWQQSYEFFHFYQNNWFEMVYPGDRLHVLEAFEKAKVLPEVRVEYRIMRPGGEVRWVQTHGFALQDDQGKNYRMVGVAEDITDRKNSELDLIRSRNLAEAIFNQASDALFLVDPATGNVMDCNQRAVEIFEALDKQEILHCPLNNFLKYPLGQEQSQSLTQQLQEQDIWHSELEYVTFQGMEFWGNVTAKSLVSSGYNLYLFRITDVTTQKEAEASILRSWQKAKELTNLKSRFIAMTSHEFRTPLAVISSSVGILSCFGDQLTPQKRQYHLEVIQTYVRHTTNLLDDILLLNRAELGELSFHPAPLGLVNFCLGICQELGLSEDNDRFEFKLESEGLPVPPQDWETLLDSKLVRQILNNLLSNAIKYSQPTDLIRLELSLNCEQIMIQVQDSGMGIPAADLEHLFEDFHRASNVGNIQGTGLGLAIVKKCVEIHGGTIAVESQESQGTTFTAILPVLKSLSSFSSQPPSPPNLT
jgi:PAS domain S-box-containing protein